MGRGSPEIQGFVYSFRRMMAVRIKILGAKFFFGNHHAGSSLGTSDSKSFAPRSCYPTTWARNAFSPPRRRSGSLLFWGQPDLRGLNRTWRNGRRPPHAWQGTCGKIDVTGHPDDDRYESDRKSTR